MRFWAPSTGQEHEVGVWMLAPQCPQQPQLVTLKAMIAGRAILGALDVDRSRIKMDLLPAKVHQFTHPQRVQEGHPNQQTIATIDGPERDKTLPARSIRSFRRIGKNRDGVGCVAAFVVVTVQQKAPDDAGAYSLLETREVSSAARTRCCSRRSGS
jgi:hypothetical protein